MQGQETRNNLFCLYKDCEDLALFGDYCKAHQFQRAVIAEARAAQLENDLVNETTQHQETVESYKRLEAESDELRGKLEQAQHKIDELTGSMRFLEGHS